MSHSMTTELEEAQQAYREAARDFAQAELAPHAARWDAEGIFPREAIAKAGELGFCGLYMDPEVGGSGLSRLDAAVVIEELANVDPSTAAYISIHNMASWMVSTWGQPALRDAWGTDLSSGNKLASYCLTEPGAGSDAASLKTTAVRDGDHYVLNGSKAFISGAGATELLVVMARTGGTGAGGVSAIAVPSDLPGISFGRKEEKMGWNSQPTRGSRKASPSARFTPIACNRGHCCSPIRRRGCRLSTSTGSAMRVLAQRPSQVRAMASSWQVRKRSRAWWPPKAAVHAASSQPAAACHCRCSSGALPCPPSIQVCPPPSARTACSKRVDRCGCMASLKARAPATKGSWSITLRSNSTTGVPSGSSSRCS